MSAGLRDASLPQLLDVWRGVIHDKLVDESWIARLPDEVALGELREQIREEFAAMADELRRRADQEQRQNASGMRRCDTR